MRTTRSRATRPGRRNHGAKRAVLSRRQSLIGKSRTHQRDGNLRESIIEGAESKLGSQPGLQRIRGHLDHYLKHVGSNEDLMDELRERADEEYRRHQNMIPAAVNLGRTLQKPMVRQRFREEVLKTAALMNASGPATWDRLHDVVGRDLMRSTENQIPARTIGVGECLEIGLGVGGEYFFGVAGKRHNNVVRYAAGTLGAGTYAEVSGTIEVEIAPCSPLQMGGLTVGIDGGIGVYGVAVGISFAFTPHLLEPRWRDRWEYDSFTVAVGGGLGIEGSCWMEWCKVNPLRPT